MWYSWHLHFSFVTSCKDHPVQLWDAFTADRRTAYVPYNDMVRCCCHGMCTCTWVCTCVYVTLRLTLMRYLCERFHTWVTYVYVHYVYLCVVCRGTCTCNCSTLQCSAVGSSHGLSLVTSFVSSALYIPLYVSACVLARFCVWHAWDFHYHAVVIIYIRSWNLTM